MADQKEPLSWRPKLLAFKEAVALHDCRLILRDLQFAARCFESIESREYGVAFPSMRSPDESNFGDWCKFVSAGIYYRRCFGTGVRVRLSRDEICKVLSDVELALHDALTAIVDKHIAHSVNEMEIGCTNIYVAIDSGGQLHRGGLGANTLEIGALGPPAYAAIRVMISKIIAEVVGVRIASLERSAEEAVSRMSDQEILDLPDGFAPHIERAQYGKPRSWPK